MKKFLTFLLCLFLVTQLHAGVDTLEGQATSGMSNWEGQDISTPVIDTVEGQAVVVDPCTTMGASGTYMFWLNFDYDSDTDTACVNSGAGTQEPSATNGATIDTWTNHGISGPSNGGTYGVKLDATGEYIRYAITAADIIDTDEGTLAFDVYMGTTTGNDHFFWAYQGAQDYMYLRGTAGGSGDAQVGSSHMGDNQNVANITSNRIDDDTWTEVRFSWSKTEVATGITSIKIGANAWEDDTDASTLTSLSPAATVISVGDSASGGIADTIYMDNLRTSSTYKDGSL